MRRNVGLDLGTTNSALAIATDAGKVTLAQFSHQGGLTDTFRSILYFHPDAADERRAITSVAGTVAIERYLEADGTGRLIQSLKSYLADRGFESTNVFGRNYSLVELLSFLVRALRAHAEGELGALGSRVVVGRPVHFSSGQGEEDDAFAESRLRAALTAGGFADVVFEYEPVAAAYYYESRLDHDELVLIADFGGGTSDFSLVRVGPGARKQAEAAGGANRILGTDGVGLAGDALDAKILHNLVSPSLGLGSTYRSMLGKDLAAPVWLYARLRKWHLLSFLKSKKTLDLLNEMHEMASEPEKMAALLAVVENDLGYHLYRAIERSKVELSQREATRFAFHEPPVHIEHDVTRAQFDRWIAEETASMAACVDRLLVRAGVLTGDVDRVFMTRGNVVRPCRTRALRRALRSGPHRGGGRDDLRGQRARAPGARAHLIARSAPWPSCSKRRSAGPRGPAAARDERRYTRRRNVIDRLCTLLRHRTVVALTGAGLSTESGIPDYRSPEALATRRPIHGPDFVRSEAVRRRYWARSTLGWERMRAAEPNDGHRALAALERSGVVVHVVTQNVDRLHRKGGSERVTELHGALAEVACLACGALEERDALQERLLALNPEWTAHEGLAAPDGDAELPLDLVERFRVPACAQCEGVLKPRVVFFGDSVPRPVVDEAFAAVDAAEVLLVVGTSLAVYSGYRFLRRAVERRIPLAIVNRGPVRGEEHATLKLEESTGTTLDALAKQLAKQA